MLSCGVDAATLVAALGAGPPPPECRWGRRPHGEPIGESIGNEQCLRSSASGVCVRKRIELEDATSVALGVRSSG